ncbi:hypothetical protein F5Y18DRAFT_229126 [Xylariaceae sp. FL1019]|nr:hypothetical protein F5Y18DRAFT_229126 [Xylariaceae sp. FL1019]
MIMLVMVINLTVRVLHDGRAEKIILHIHVLHRNIHPGTTGLHPSHAGLDGTHPGLHSLQSLLYTLEPLTDADEPLSEVMPNAIKLVAQAANALGHGGVLLAGWSSGNTSFVVVPRVLDGEAPLIVQLHLAYSLGTPWTVDLARAGVSLLGSAIVLDTSAVADQIVARRLTIAVVAGTELDNTVALVLSHSLDGCQKIVKASVDALWRRCKSARLARDHGSRCDRSGSRRRRDGGHLTRRAEGAGVAIGDNHAGGNSRVVGVLLERNFGGVLIDGWEKGKNEDRPRGRRSHRGVDGEVCQKCTRWWPARTRWTRALAGGHGERNGIQTLLVVVQTSSHGIAPCVKEKIRSQSSTTASRRPCEGMA